MTDSISCTLTEKQIAALYDLPHDGGWLTRPGYRWRRIESLQRYWPHCVERGTGRNGARRYRLTESGIEAKTLWLSMRDERGARLIAKARDGDQAILMLRNYLQRFTCGQVGAATEHALKIIAALNDSGFGVVRI